MCLSVPAELISVSGSPGLAYSGRVSFSGVIKEISLAYVPEARVGDFVLVHVGFALSVLDRQEAAELLESLEQLGRP